MLTFRSEWGGAGAYPNIQMGIVHTGFAYIDKNGNLHNLDNPMDGEYLGPGNLTSEHYRTLNFLHIIRPRNLTDAAASQHRSPGRRSSTPAPARSIRARSASTRTTTRRNSAGRHVEFVKRARARSRSARTQPGKRSTCTARSSSGRCCRCGIAIRPRPPRRSRAAGVPSCVKRAMEPMKATGNVLPRHGRNSYSGLADGPLLVVDSMKLPDAERKQIMRQRVHREPRRAWPRCRSATGTVAEQMQPKFAKLEGYYLGMTGRMWQNWRARLIGTGFNWAGIPENYSPDVLPDQHAAAAGQQQPHDGLRGDDRVSSSRADQGVDAAETAMTQSIAGNSCRASRWPPARTLAPPVRAEDAAPVYIGDMHSHLFFFGMGKSPAKSPLGPAMAAGNATLVAWSLVGDVPWLHGHVERHQAEGRCRSPARRAPGSRAT